MFDTHIAFFQDECDNANKKGETYVARAKELLGLGIAKTTENSTVLTFTHVDKLDSERQFLCEFTLSGPANREYKGTPAKFHEPLF